MGKNLIVILLILFSLSIYTLTLKGIYGNPQGENIRDNLDSATMPFELSPERGRFLLVQSIAHNNSFALSPNLARAAEPDVGYHEGKSYIYFPPGISLIALPFYLIGYQYDVSQIAAFFSVTLFAALTVGTIYLIARYVLILPIWASIAASIIYAFGSSSWSYAVTLYQHHTTTFFMLSAFLAVWKYRQGSRYSWIYGLYVWLAYGIAIFLDYPNILLLSPVMLYFLISAVSLKKVISSWKVTLRGSFLLTSIVFISLSVAHGYYNQYHFGDWKRLSGSLPGYKQLVELEGQDVENLAAGAEAADQKNVAGFFREEALPKGFVILTVAIDKGLFVFAPIFILGIAGIIAAAKKINAEIATLLGLIGVNIFLYSSWGDPWGGWAFGPRYLIPSMALLSLFIALFLSKTYKYLIFRITALVLFAISSAISLVGVLTTNQVPPKVEADYLGMKYNYLLNYDYFVNGQSSSFLFNTYFHEILTLQEYFYIIFASLIFLMTVVLFIFPRLDKTHEH